MRPRQRVLDEYYSRSIRAIEVFKHNQFVPVKEDDYKRELKKNERR